LAAILIWKRDKMTNDTWGQARETLQASIGKNNYVTWIEPLIFLSCEDGVAEFGVQTSFQGDWVSRNFGDEILRQFDQLGADVNRLKFSVQSIRPVAAKPATSPQSEGLKTTRAAAPSLPEDPLLGAPLDKRFTFDRFVVGKPNELAHAAARRVAEGGPVSFNPLFLYGGVGLGKTHLMHAIAWELQQRSPELRVVYLSAEQFMYRFIQALRERQMMDFKSLFRSVDVLMVDDVQFIAGKDSTQDEFFHTFNALIDQQKQIIISADCSPGEIDGLARRRIDPPVRVGIAGGPRDYAGDGARKPCRHPSPVRPQGHHGRNHAQDLRLLQRPHVRPAVAQTLAQHRAAAPNGDVAGQAPDSALLPRNRQALWQPRPHHSDPRSAQDR